MEISGIIYEKIRRSKTQKEKVKVHLTKAQDCKINIDKRKTSSAYRTHIVPTFEHLFTANLSYTSNLSTNT